MTLVVSSHILAELEEYSTHMLVLRAGRIVEHRALESATATRRLRVRLASADGRLATRLAATAGITELESRADEASFEWSGDIAAQAALLRELVAEGFAVASLEEERASLQDSYLRTVDGEPR